MIDVLPLFKALADESRMKIAALTSAKPLSVEELAVATGLKPATVSHHLSILRGAGLVEGTREQYYAVYRFNQQPLLDALRTLSESPRPSELDADLDQYDQKVLRDYLVDGKLKTIPVQRKKRDVILRYLATQFEPGHAYSEKEVNQILVAFHDDVATLRREMVGAEPPLLKRENGVYQLAGAPGSLAERHRL